jgi:hypothetical protein
LVLPSGFYSLNLFFFFQEHRVDSAWLCAIPHYFARKQFGLLLPVNDRRKCVNLWGERALGEFWMQLGLVVNDNVSVKVSFKPIADFKQFGHQLLDRPLL